MSLLKNKNAIFAFKNLIMMKNMFRRISLLLLTMTLSLAPLHGANIDSLISVLDETIAHQRHYDEIRETSIKKLLAQKAAVSNSYIAQYNANNKLVDAYKAYKHDDVVKYLNQNLELAKRHHDVYRINKTRLRLISTFANAGMYLESVNMIAAIDRKTISGDLLFDYYDACRRAYGQSGTYSNDQPSRAYYSLLGKAYRDSLLALLPVGSARYYQEMESKYIDAHQPRQALRINNLWLRKVRPDTPEYSMACYFRSVDYKNMKDSRMEEYWLLLSAISDIRSAIKDQASLWTLATILSQRGDVNRAFKYIRVSWDETKFFNAPLRNQQTLKGLSAIDEVYQAKIEKQNVSLRIYLTITIALAVILAIAILLVYKQMNKLSVAHHSISVANRKLSESNKIKEEYIGRFLTLCSFYVDRLESFRTTIARKSRSGQLAEYLNDSKIKNMKDEDLANLLKSFDTAFLRLFPHFVSDFNALLAPDQQMKIAGDELLNTELRIFALIRLGVEDSSKIAEFLHYSANTIYNYRARIKKNSIVPREEFEKYVMKIGE